MNRPPLTSLVRLFACLLLVGLCLPACGGGGDAADDEVELPPLEDDLVPETAGKSDTGYLSNLAMELEGEFEATVVVDLSDRSEEDRKTYVTELREGGWSLRSLADAQLKFAKNQLNTEKLHVNLTGSDAEGIEFVEEGATVTVRYRLTVDTIVSFEELEEAGVDPNNLTAQRFDVRLPSDPNTAFEKGGEACAEGHDEGSLADYNYFYYFKPDKQGCELALSDGAFTVRSLLPQKTTYPEYDRLVADGRVEVVAFFGQAGHDPEVSYYDEGAREHREFVNFVERRGFATEDGFDVGQRYARTRGDLVEVIDIVSPTELKSLKEDRDGVFKAAVQSHEVILYNGHSFYGSLSVLEDPETWPADTYQVLFINSCWSYEYYTEQIFRNKVTEADPTGWGLADVVNDTESGWFMNMAEESRILLTNLFAGAEHGGRDGNRHFTWANVIGQMNKHAIDRYTSWGLKSHEIYGVSGVRSNTFEP